MRERTLERTLKELELHSSSRFQFRAKFQISTCPNLNRRLSLDGSPVCVCHHFTVYDSSDGILTLTLARSSRRRADPIVVVGPARETDADAHRRRRERKGRPRGVVGSTLEPVSTTGPEFTHSRIHSSRIEFGSNRPCRTRRGRNCIGLGDTKDAIRSGERRSDERRSDGDSRKSRTETSGKGASRRPIAREREGEGMHRTNASIIGRVVSISFENDDLD